MTQPSPDEPHVEALVAAVMAAHGAHIPAEQTDKIRESVKGLRAAVAALDAYHLTNADEPDPIFAAYRSDG
jgi:hypothetical protein